MHSSTHPSLHSFIFYLHPVQLSGANGAKHTWSSDNTRQITVHIILPEVMFTLTFWMATLYSHPKIFP